jgi:post-segregation antitoxin (ccd killing protein)
MARVNVYLPDDLASAARSARLNISSLTQDALRRELQQVDVIKWIDEVHRLSPSRIGHEAVLEAINAAREEL